jgi:glycosyltransferase involved in cell wall biosynthesis/CelD/BcsL family acetyltransferase involved in cellulose biosynthesis
MSNSHYRVEPQLRSLELIDQPIVAASAPPLPHTQAARRVLFVAYQFAPSLEMGARSCVQIARYLPLYGWSPVVLTAHEKYIEERYRGSDDEIAKLGLPDAIVRTRLLSHPLDFYRWLISAFRRQPHDTSGTGAAESDILADRPLAAKGRLREKLRRLILPTLCAPDIYTGWIPPAIVAGLRAVRESKAEQIFSSGPFWTNHLVGLALSYLTGLPWTAHFRDPWVAGAWQSSTTTFADWLNKWLERVVVTRATSVVSVTEEHSAAFREAYPRLPADKFFTVTNGYDNEEWEKEPTGVWREQKGEGKFLIAYTGKFYIERDPRPLFRALRVLIDSGEIEREKVQVDLVGWCETSEGRSVREMAEEFGVSDCVNILGPRSRPETIRRMIQADLLLLLAERFIIQIPGKTYEYLRAGRPILALTPEGALANFMRRTGAGWAVNQKDDAGIMGAVRERYRQWKAGEPGPSADPKIIAGFDRRKLAGRLAELFDHLYLTSLQTGLSLTKPREGREKTEKREKTETGLVKAFPSFPYSLSAPQDKVHTATARSMNGAPNETKMSVMAIARLAELEWFLPAWEDLAASALEPNVFYEPWMMMPALHNLGSTNTLLTALIFTTDPARPGTPLLCGLFPLECGRGYKGAPVKFLRLWRHKHCFLTTPLIRAGYERQTLEVFFDWLATDARSGALIEFDMLPGEGQFHQTLVDYLYRSGKTNRIFESYTRALMQPAADADTYLCAALSAKHRKMIRRLERGLSEIGRLEYDSLTPDDAADVWIKEFLQLEASGWKGRESSALASNELERSYFKSIAREAFRRGRLAMLALRLDGRPIAYKCDFLAGRGSFTFKIAFDESYARFSPGMLLEIENLRRLHAQSQVEWVDSCADPFNFMFNRLWLARRTIQNLTVSTGKAPGDLIVSMTPLLSWINRKLKTG